MLEDGYLPGNPTHAGGAWLVVLSGCSGAGKSSLLSALAARGYPVQPEAGRQIVKEQLLIGGDALPWRNAARFVELAASRAAWQFNSAAPTDKPVVFDRSVVDVVSFLAHKGLATPTPLQRMLEFYRYAPRVFMTPPWEELFRNDAERRKDFGEALAEYRSLIAAYEDLGYEIVELPKVSVAARADFFERCVGG